MKPPDDRRIRDLLKSAFPPLGDVEPSRELWPRLLRRLEGTSLRVPWFDWALVALLPAWCVAFPKAVLFLLYQM
jgi:hypothetical protein